MIRSVRLSLAFGLCLLVGCSGGTPKLVSVKGQVRYRGHPVPNATIVFVPDEERGGSGPLATAVLGPDGRFELQTGQLPGCVPGWHRVTIATAGTNWRLPDHYRDPDLSGQRVEVKAGQNTCDIRLD